MNGEDGLRRYPTVYQNLWAFGSHEAQFRRLCSDEKQGSHREAVKEYARINESVAELAVALTGR